MITTANPGPLIDGNQSREGTLDEACQCPGQVIVGKIGAAIGEVAIQAVDAIQGTKRVLICVEAEKLDVDPFGPRRSSSDPRTASIEMTTARKQVPAARTPAVLGEFSKGPNHLSSESPELRNKVNSSKVLSMAQLKSIQRAVAPALEIKCGDSAALNQLASMWWENVDYAQYLRSLAQSSHSLLTLWWGELMSVTKYMRRDAIRLHLQRIGMSWARGGTLTKCGIIGTLEQSQALRRQRDYYHAERNRAGTFEGMELGEEAGKKADALLSVNMQETRRVNKQRKERRARARLVRRRPDRVELVEWKRNGVVRARLVYPARGAVIRMFRDGKEVIGMLGAGAKKGDGPVAPIPIDVQPAQATRKQRRRVARGNRRPQHETERKLQERPVDGDKVAGLISVDVALFDFLGTCMQCKKKEVHVAESTRNRGSVFCLDCFVKYNTHRRRKGAECDEPIRINKMVTVKGTATPANEVLKDWLNEKATELLPEVKPEIDFIVENVDRDRLLGLLEDDEQLLNFFLEALAAKPQRVPLLVEEMHVVGDAEAVPGRVDGAGDVGAEIPSQEGYVQTAGLDEQSPVETNNGANLPEPQGGVPAFLEETDTQPEVAGHQTDSSSDNGEASDEEEGDLSTKMSIATRVALDAKNRPMPFMHFFPLARNRGVQMRGVGKMQTLPSFLMRRYMEMTTILVAASVVAALTFALTHATLHVALMALQTIQVQWEDPMITMDTLMIQVAGSIDRAYKLLMWSPIAAFGAVVESLGELTISMAKLLLDATLELSVIPVVAWLFPEPAPSGHALIMPLTGRRSCSERWYLLRRKIRIDHGEGIFSWLYGSLRNAVGFEECEYVCGLPLIKVELPFLGPTRDISLIVYGLLIIGLLVMTVTRKIIREYQKYADSFDAADRTPFADVDTATFYEIVESQLLDKLEGDQRLPRCKLLGGYKIRDRRVRAAVYTWDMKPIPIVIALWNDPLETYKAWWSGRKLCYVSEPVMITNQVVDVGIFLSGYANSVRDQLTCLNTSAVRQNALLQDFNHEGEALDVNSMRLLTAIRHWKGKENDLFLPEGFR